MAEALKDRIRRLRKVRGLTLQTVAEKVGGLTPAAVSHWESGRSEPKPEALRSLAKVLGIAVEELRGSVSNAAGPRERSDDNAEIDAILADAERRIGKLIGRPSGQVTVSYSVTRRS